MRDWAVLKFTSSLIRTGNSTHHIILLHKVSEINHFTLKDVHVKD